MQRRTRWGRCVPASEAGQVREGQTAWSGRMRPTGEQPRTPCPPAGGHKGSPGEDLPAVLTLQDCAPVRGPGGGFLHPCLLSGCSSRPSLGKRHRWGAPCAPTATALVSREFPATPNLCTIAGRLTACRSCFSEEPPPSGFPAAVASGRGRGTRPVTPAAPQADLEHTMLTHRRAHTRGRITWDPRI